MSADYSLAQAPPGGATVHQLRTYVSCGLVKPCARTAAGHHRFNDDCVARLRLIVAATGAGLRIAEIGGLIRAIECGARDDVAVARRMLVAARGSAGRLEEAGRNAVECVRPGGS